MTLKRSSTATMQESSIVKSNFKKTKLSDSAALGSNLTSKEYSKLKKAGKTGNVNLNRIKADNPIVKNNEKSARENDAHVETETSVKVFKKKVFDKLTKKQKKKLREKRRLYYDEAIDIKQTWELLRNEDDKKKKKELTESIWEKLSDKEKLLQLCYSHDTCRVICWAYRCSSEDRKAKTFDTLFTSFEKLATSRHAKHMALTMVRHGSKSQRIKLMESLTGKIRDLFLHCSANDVVEELYNCHANERQRAAMYHEIYSRYFVMKAQQEIQNADDKSGTQKQQIKSLQIKLGNVSLSFINDVVEELYNCHANERQRAAMYHEIYSRYFVMKAQEEIQNADDKSGTQKQQIKSLQMLLDKSPHLRSPVLSTVKAFILKCVSTNSVRHSFAHKIILEYFNVLQNSSSSTNKSASSVENEKEKEGDERKNITEEGLFEDGEQPAKQVQDGKAVIGEIVPLCRDWLIQMAHTPNGAKIVVYALWYSDAKDRKAILKMFKEKIVEISQHESAYLIICAILDCVDDTKLINISVLQPLLKQFSQIITNTYGLRSVIYAICPRYSLLFNAEIREFLSLGDSNDNSRKPKEVRYKECAQVMQLTVQQYLCSKLEESSGALEDKTNYQLTSAFLSSDYVENSVKQPLLEKISSLCFETDEFLTSFLSYSVVKGILKDGHPNRDEFAQMMLPKVNEFEKDVLKGWSEQSRKLNVLRILAEKDEKFKRKLQTVIPDKL